MHSEIITMSLSKCKVFKEWLIKTRIKLIELMKNSYLLVECILHYSGIKFIFRKFCPSKSSGELPTGLLWFIGIYVSLFGIAWQRYENRTFEIDNLVENSITAQLASNKLHYVLSRIPNIQWQPCPLKPEIFNLKSVFISLFGDYRQHEVQVDYLKDILIDHRDMLKSLNLGYCDLRGTIFMGGNFEESLLLYAKLDQAIFNQVSFKNTDFFNAKFNNAWFNECDFSGSNFHSVDLKDTFFSNCNFEETKNIKLEQLLKCRSLYKSTIKPEWLKVIKKDHSNILEWPNRGQSIDKLKTLMKRNVPKYFENIFKEHNSD